MKRNYKRVFTQIERWKASDHLEYLIICKMIVKHFRYLTEMKRREVEDSMAEKRKASSAIEIIYKAVQFSVILSSK